MPAADELVAPDVEPVVLAQGNIYISAQLCEQFFQDAQSVALLFRHQQLLLLPLHGQNVGGLLLKIRNLRGDRVIHAQEFVRQHGLPETANSIYCAVQWDAELHALRITV